MQCPSCGQPLEPEAELCLECGEVIDPSMSSSMSPSMSPSMSASASREEPHKMVPPSPQAQLVQRVVTSHPELSPEAQRTTPTDAARRPQSSPAILWREHAPHPPSAAPLVGPAAIQKPRRRPVEEKVRCRGCGVMNEAEADRCRGCGERMRRA